MAYRKINVELIVFAEEADSVIAALNTAMDQLEVTHTVFGGGIDVTPVSKSAARKKSALMHTLAAGCSALAAVRLAGDKVAGAYRKVI